MSTTIPMNDQIDRLLESVGRVYLGNPDAVEQLVRCLLARGHALIEDVPGVGKTILASALARSVDCRFTRLQLTPDMLPSDVLGVTMYHQDTGKFEFRKGPVFTDILLADEINRTTPRTQTALLEAMSEARVSMDGEVYDLGQPFMVIATQNPYEFAGTYLLPENQLDRFLMRISLGYPGVEAEARLLDLRPAATVLQELEPVLHADDVVALQRRVDEVRLEPAVRDYIVAVARATRDEDEIQVGLSPRGTLALAHAARATALMDHRDHVIPEDVLDNVVAVGAHRMLLRESAAGVDWERAAVAIRRAAQSVQAPL
ncbi:MAG: MoxR-like ATPase [Phycisphaeraceae bacterium]|nr:MAG: MoxR-like ATPase [Phycisphaeraceae bacterium]